MLTWQASNGATSYHVKRSNSASGPFSTIASPTAATYTDTALTNGTQYYYVASAISAAGESANSATVSATPTVSTPDVTISVTASTTHPISPYIYGSNFATTVAGAPPALTLDRAGGNRYTAYNWETNASNAGSDYMYENDSYLSTSNTPGAAVTSIISADQNAGMATMVTFQMQGLAAGDENGPVSVTQSAGHDPLQERHRAKKTPNRKPPLHSVRRAAMPMCTWMSSYGR